MRIKIKDIIIVVLVLIIMYLSFQKLNIRNDKIPEWDNDPTYLMVQTEVLEEAFFHSIRNDGSIVNDIEIYKDSGWQRYISLRNRKLQVGFVYGTAFQTISLCSWS